MSSKSSRCDNGPKRKRLSPLSPHQASSSASESLKVSGKNDHDDPSSSKLEPADFRCLICFDTMKEPTATFCGHSFCRKCILRTLETTERCPNCTAKLGKDNVFPNYALCDIMARQKRAEGRFANACKSSLKDPMTTESASTSGEEMSSDQKLINLLMQSKMEYRSVYELDDLVQVLQQKREVLTNADEMCNRQLILEFLSQQQAIKTTKLEHVITDLDLIDNDIAKLESEAEAAAKCPKGPSYICELFSVGDLTSQSSVTEAKNKALETRKNRMEHCFEELSQMYFETRNSAIAAEVDDITLEGASLREFATTLSHLTQYDRFKPLATVNCDPKVILHNCQAYPCLVTSIAFDKDSEFFAVASTLRKIKLYEYTNVVGSPKGMMKCPNSELPVTSKVSCVTWNGYYKNQLASAAYDGKITLLDACSSSNIRDFKEHEKRTWSIDWSSANPRLLASGSDDSWVKLWSANCDKAVANLKTPTNVCSVKFRPGSYHSIAFGSADHCAYLYDLRSPKEPFGILSGHAETVSYVQFTDHNNELLSVSTDGSIKLWNLEEGQNDQDSMSCVRSFTGHVNSRRFVGLHAEGNYIACGSENNSCYVYYKKLSKPLFSFKFESFVSSLSGGGRQPAESSRGEFVSALAWKKDSSVVLAGNSRGIVNVLELA